MKFLVVSDAPILQQNNLKVAYAPYVREMEIWMSQASKTTFICPKIYDRKLLTLPFITQNFLQVPLRRLEFHTFLSSLISLLSIPYQSVILIKEMLKADHIHLRAPGNLVLLASFVQLLFPRKRKTVKYAGNWDHNAKQPISYRIQKAVLRNTFLTRNCNILVYGAYPNQTKNVKPFFTATYTQHQIAVQNKRDYTGKLKMLFVGSLVPGKRPEYAVAFVQELHKSGMNVSLDIYGDGPLRSQLEDAIAKNKLGNIIEVKGNQEAYLVEEAYKKSHFLLLPSQSEGWPKVVAEAMFWGCIPLVTPISCVPWMVDNGNRGLLLTLDLTNDYAAFAKMLAHPQYLDTMSLEAQKWSQKYTLDAFESEIKKLL